MRLPTDAPGNARARVGRTTPERILTLGVTGHRPQRLEGCDLEWLAGEVARVLDLMADAAGAGGATRHRLVSPLAEGADSIVSDAVLLRGWTLDVVLPFPRACYAEDFLQPGAARAFGRQLGAAGSVMELPGDRDAEDGEAAAYERAGRIVLAQCDLLLAIWDGTPVRGRGGAAQIVSEAVLAGIPVVRIDPTRRHPTELLWDGLEEFDLGQQSVDTVARGDLSRLGALFRLLLDAPVAVEDAAMLARFETGGLRYRAGGVAYPLLLAVMGVRRPRWRDLWFDARPGAGRPEIASCAFGDDFACRIDTVVGSRFARADAAATRIAQLFRSSYVTNFLLAALAVVLAMAGLALPTWTKPILMVLEVLTIGAILIITRRGNRAHWHRLWLDNRTLAERLRGLALSAQLGDLALRDGDDETAGWVEWYVRATARELGLPDIRVDDTYLRCIRDELLKLIDAQIAYQATDARRMHLLDHRLHRAGTILFTLTALACVSLLAFKAMQGMTGALDGIQNPFATGVTIVSAALPAIGAAIYGIRMQGDFAGLAGRSEALSRDLETLRQVVCADALDFDTLSRRVRRVADLLSNDLASWLQTYHARPLVLPG